MTDQENSNSLKDLRVREDWQLNMSSYCNQITAKINGILKSTSHEEMAQSREHSAGPTNFRCSARNRVLVGKVRKMSFSEAGIHLF